MKEANTPISTAAVAITVTSQNNSCTAGHRNSVTRTVVDRNRDDRDDRAIVCHKSSPFSDRFPFASTRSPRRHLRFLRRAVREKQRGEQAWSGLFQGVEEKCRDDSAALFCSRQKKNPPAQDKTGGAGRKLYARLRGVARGRAR
jgi:hypothetical protein